MWLKPHVGANEILPPGYNVYRRDRGDGWGGVLLAVRSDLVSHEYQIANDSGVELVAAKVYCGGHMVIAGAFYRPPDSGQSYADDLT